MSAVVWVAVIASLVLIGFGIASVVSTFRRGLGHIDDFTQDGLTEIDRASWESEMNQ